LNISFSERLAVAMIARLSWVAASSP